MVASNQGHRGGRGYTRDVDSGDPEAKASGNGCADHDREKSSLEHSGIRKMQVFPQHPSLGIPRPLLSLARPLSLTCTPTPVLALPCPVLLRLPG